MVEGTKAKGMFKVDNYVGVHDPEFQKEKQWTTNSKEPEACTAVRV